MSENWNGVTTKERYEEANEQMRELLGWKQNKETQMEAKLRAKIQIGNITDNKNTSGEKYSENINAHAVYSFDPESENAQWAQATPSFHLSMLINNPAAFGKLEQGKQYYIDFIPAE